MGVKAEILWCPTASDIFLTWGSDIQIYQTRNVAASAETSSSLLGGFQISDSTVASLICTSTDYSYIKCVAWSNTVAPDGAKLLAVGQANGKVHVTSLATLLGDGAQQHNREYVPRHGRCVNSLCWSEGSDPNLLLAALDRSGRDPSLLLYDVSRLPSTTQPSPSSSSSRHQQQIQQSGGWQRPSGEFCNNEVVHSAVFSRQTRNIIIAAASHKYLKILDIRNGSNTLSINTKAVYGLCCDPHSHYRIASYCDNLAHIWDLRHTSMPSVTLSMPRPIIKIQWCPTRYGFLGCLSRECSSVRLFDVQFAGCDMQEASVAMRVAADTSPAYTSTFSWHHQRHNVLLTAASTEIAPPSNMSRPASKGPRLWSGVEECSRSPLYHHRLPHLYTTTDSLTPIPPPTPSPLYHHRLPHPYTTTDSLTPIPCKENMARNGAVAQAVGWLSRDGAASLASVWGWMARAHVLAKAASYRLRTGLPYNYHGLLERCSSRPVSYTHLDVYKRQALQRGGVSDVLSDVPYRGAALAVFQLHLPRAISLLQAAAAHRHDPAINAVAMALAGYSGERKLLWRDTCASLRQSLSDPHLRAMFAFLTEDTESYSPLLLSSDLSVCDRIGFALTFLSDVSLAEFLTLLLTQLTQAPCPDLQGLILTGMSDEGVSLVQRYVDRTSDVQTAALLAVHGFRHAVAPSPSDAPTSPDSPLNFWIESYLQLLTSLQLWAERAALVVLVPQDPPPPQHVVLACDYCNKSISSPHAGLPHSPNKPQLARMLQAAQQQHTKNKTVSMSGKLQSEKSGSDDAPNAPSHLFIPSNTQALLRDNLPGLNPFANWFTWCQTCKHGGHANHIMDWFSEHEECPVTGCTCQCLLQDKIGRPSRGPAPADAHAPLAEASPRPVIRQHS
ncbi:GATOR complex protein MIOS-A [Hyalella azteca]|uniref:GATOR complex protein MIOS-A n=1 Tax=Hyalella azteca TaxID=294128 RepID=A0A8B7NCX6_HYAAZ|nr:GATOR complex protein MIOS-A [Hyalella azteca]